MQGYCSVRGSLLSTANAVILNMRQMYDPPDGGPCGRVDRNGAGWMGAHAPLDWSEAGEASLSVVADLHAADVVAEAVVAGREVAAGSVLGACSRCTEGQPEADATPAPAVTPVMGLGLAGARKGDGAD